MEIQQNLELTYVGEVIDKAPAIIASLMDKKVHKAQGESKERESAELALDMLVDALREAGIKVPVSEGRRSIRRYKEDVFKDLKEALKPEITR